MQWLLSLRSTDSRRCGDQELRLMGPGACHLLSVNKGSQITMVITFTGVDFHLNLNSPNSRISMGQEAIKPGHREAAFPAHSLALPSTPFLLREREGSCRQTAPHPCLQPLCCKEALSRISPGSWGKGCPENGFPSLGWIPELRPQMSHPRSGQVCQLPSDTPLDPSGLRGHFKFLPVLSLRYLFSHL